MLKWILAAVGFLAVMIAIFVGVVLFLFNREDPDMSNLTELHAAEVLDATDLGSSYRVVYEYTYDGQTYYGRATRSGSIVPPSGRISICMDPSEPAHHAQTQTDCSPGEPRNPQVGLKEKPDL